MKREKMARGNVIDVDDVEARVDIRGDAAGSGIEDDPARRRGFHIARPDRCRGVDDHHRGTRLRDLAGKLLREKLRSLVLADNVGGIEPYLLDFLRVYVGMPDR